MSEAERVSFVRVEHHMSTAITLAGDNIDDAEADRFFSAVAELEDLLSRFRPASQISRFARGELDADRLDPLVREVLARCETLRDLTDGDFEHEPRQRSGRDEDPVLDVNALAKGWIIEEAARPLRMTSAEFFVNAGGDVTTSRRSAAPWRVGIQHPDDPAAILGVFDVTRGAVATSGIYERGEHIRGEGSALSSVTVVGPDLGDADGLATAVFAAGMSPPAWWSRVAPVFGLLTLSADNRLRWLPPTEGNDFEFHFPTGSEPTTSIVSIAPDRTTTPN